MSRHVLDRPRTADATRTRRYLEAERREGLHPATQALIRRERPASGSRNVAYLRIAREDREARGA
jgi:hypothetical protein